MSDALAASNDAKLSFAIEWEQTEATVNAARRKLAALTRKAQADGIPTKSIIEASRKRRAHGAETVPYMRQLIQAMALRDIPMTAEAMFDGWDTMVSTSVLEDDQAWRAQDAGFKEGMAGADRDVNPFQPGTLRQQAWERGRRAGIAAREAKAGPAAKAATAPRKRPQRGRQTRLPGTEQRAPKKLKADPKRGRGRPKGSKTKPKLRVVESGAQPAA
jgi:ribosome modulation factor